MAWHLRLWRRVPVAPGVSVNLSKSGPSLSVGPRGAKTTIGRRGIRRTIGIPGTGIYATDQESWAKIRGGTTEPHQPAPSPELEARNAVDPGAPAGRCAFCGGRAGADGRCGMCGQAIT